MRIAAWIAVGVGLLVLAGCSQPEKPTADDSAFNSELKQAAAANAGKTNPGGRNRMTKVSGAPAGTGAATGK